MSDQAGITEAEVRVMDGLNAALRAWHALPEHHPSDIEDFVFHVHALQNMVAFHVARRINPEFWWAPKKEETEREFRERCVDRG